MLWHRHKWTKFGPPQVSAGGVTFQARTCERCGAIEAREVHPWMVFHGQIDAPSIPLERDWPVHDH